MEPVNISRTWWSAPAKLNLMLRITGRRADGYHNLQTVFQLLDFGDRLAFDLREDGLIHTLNSLPGVPAKAELTTRAAILLQQASGTKHGVDIHLDKLLPLGGGLGGGSSDAATTLLALNQLWHCELSIDALAELGRQLGADVPVFVRGHSAWAEGVGEKITPMQLPDSDYLVICPPVHLSTAFMFAAPELERDMPHIEIDDFLQGEHSNAFTQPARRHSALIDQLFTLLEAHAEPRLTGSGACIFCAFAPGDPKLHDTARILPSDTPYFIAHGCNASPTHLQLVTQPS
jgi:4-diphosphocytidyl-2-C-methyl-D-erythritol kinase